MREIELTRAMVALVDDEDYEKVCKHKWYAAKGKNAFYAQRTIKENGKKKTLHMHRVLLGADESLRVDHINGNGLDNQKGNLRLATNQQNCVNVGSKHQNKTSKYKGVYKTNAGTFEVQIKVNYKSLNLGRLKDEELAAKYYDAAARYSFGEFAWCNFEEEFIQPRPLDELKEEIKSLSRLVVCQYDLEGMLIKEWGDFKEALQEARATQSFFYSIIAGKHNHIWGGYQWKKKII